MCVALRRLYITSPIHTISCLAYRVNTLLIPTAETNQTSNKRKLKRTECENVGECFFKGVIYIYASQHDDEFGIIKTIIQKINTIRYYGNN